jgi:hypothetical protein
MTAKNVLNVSFSEIGKVEITCKCGAALVFPVPQKDISGYFPPANFDCLSCKRRLWDGENDQRFLRLVGIIRCLAYWQELKDPGFGLSFSLFSN